MAFFTLLIIKNYKKGSTVVNKRTGWVVIKHLGTEREPSGVKKNCYCINNVACAVETCVFRTENQQLGSPSYLDSSTENQRTRKCQSNESRLM